MGHEPSPSVAAESVDADSLSPMLAYCIGLPVDLRVVRARQSQSDVGRLCHHRRSMARRRSRGIHPLSSGRGLGFSGAIPPAMARDRPADDHHDWRALASAHPPDGQRMGPMIVIVRIEIPGTTAAASASSSDSRISMFSAPDDAFIDHCGCRTDALARPRT